jgi:LacI family transcriptional regulator
METDVPIVTSIDHEREELKDLPKVLSDRHAAGRLAAAALAKRGFRDLGYVEFSGGDAPGPLLSGFREGAGDAACRVHYLAVDSKKNWTPGSAAYEKHAAMISEWLVGLPKPVGVLAYNHRMGARIIAGCEMVGLYVPEQVAVLCRGNWPDMCESAPVPLSAIDVNPYEHGRQLVLLLKRLNDGKAAPSQPVLVPPRGIVERRSTDILAVPDPKVAAAIRFMWDNLGLATGVDAVAEHVGTSRSTLERAFRRCLGRGVGAELRRKRLERSTELLRGTDMTVEEIVNAVGLLDVRRYRQAFENEYGLTPQQYRAQSSQAT